ncbi:MAG: hypothetical protein AAF478_10810 [Pseudomonadota bacterium]
MPSITFSSSLALTVFHTFAGGGGAVVGTTPGLVTFAIGDADSWFVYSGGGLSTEDIPILVDDLNTYGAPALQLSKSGLAGSDLGPLTGAAHLNDLILGGQWTSADMAGFTGMIQLDHLGLHETQVDDSGLASIGTHTNIEHLTLSRTLVNGSGTASLSGLSQLRELVLFQTAFSDNACALLSNVPSVRLLNLLDTNITDSGIANIAASIPNLLSLFVDRNSAVTDGSLGSLLSMANLNTLSLEGTSISNAGVTTLLGLSELIHLDTKNLPITDATCQTITADRANWQVLSFQNATMTNAALSNFHSQQSLTSLSLRCSGIDSAGISSLSACAGLVDLDLSGCILDDSALIHLASLSNLRILNVTETGGAITQAGIDVLVAAIPSLVVESDFS